MLRNHLTGLYIRVLFTQSSYFFQGCESTLNLLLYIVMAKPKLLLYVDVVSPFAYIAFQVLNVSLKHSVGPVFMKGCLWRLDGWYYWVVSLTAAAAQRTAGRHYRLRFSSSNRNRLVTAGSSRTRHPKP